MFSPLRDPAYRHLFAAQVAALLGTSLATVALGLLAHDLAGAQAGEILGAALAIKMVCYVGVAPVAGAIAANVPRKTLLVGLDLVRAAVALCMPFVSEAWQIYALMTVLYVASAAFTPAFQAMIPDILPNEADYTKALSLSRLPADLESVASPVLAAALLGFMSYNNLFAGTSLGFALSAVLVVSAALPALSSGSVRPFIRRLTAGLSLFVHTPRLRALIALSLASAAGGAMVFVNTVVLVQSEFASTERATAWALAAFGAGSMIAALTLPKLLTRLQDRTVLIAGAVVMGVGLAIGSIRERPASADDRAVPGHWEGDLLLGSNSSQIITLVERHSRYVMLAKIPNRETQTVVNALIKQARKLPDELYKSLTWDNGKELADHQRFTLETDVDIYFCDPHSPWQRGSNENTNGLLRQYFSRERT